MRYLFSIIATFLCSAILIGCGGKSDQTNDNNSEKMEIQELTIGSKAPDFTLADQNGDMHTLSNYKGKNIVLYFYPKDDTGG